MRTRKRVPRSRVLIIALFGAVLLAGGGLTWWYEYAEPVSFVAVAATPARLIDGIESYGRVDAFLVDLTRQSLEYEVKRPDPPPREARRPPFAITTVTIRRYSHLGQVGVLRVAFFNDRLVGVRFFPSAMDAYLARLLSDEGLDLKSQAEAKPSPHTRVYVATEQERGRYVGWEDTRLAAEMSLWIKRYS